MNADERRSAFIRVHLWLKKIVATDVEDAIQTRAVVFEGELAA
jgi:hypothetical protein